MCAADHVHSKIVTRQLHRMDHVPRPCGSGTQPCMIDSFLAWTAIAKLTEMKKNTKGLEIIMTRDY